MAARLRRERGSAGGPTRSSAATRPRIRTGRAGRRSARPSTSISRSTSARWSSWCPPKAEASAGATDKRVRSGRPHMSTLAVVRPSYVTEDALASPVAQRFQSLVASPLRAELLRFLHAHQDETFEICLLYTSDAADDLLC